MKNNKINIGVSGEYFVAAELERHGFIASLTAHNSKNYDILAINEDSKKQYAIQVKTCSGSGRRWQLNVKNEAIANSKTYYVFVCLNGNDHPSFYVIPSRVVAKELTTNHQKWLNQLGRNGQKHKDNNIRIYTIDDDKYLNKWDSLK